MSSPPALSWICSLSTSVGPGTDTVGGAAVGSGVVSTDSAGGSAGKSVGGDRTSLEALEQPSSTTASTLQIIPILIAACRTPEINFSAKLPMKAHARANKVFNTVAQTIVLLGSRNAITMMVITKGARANNQLQKGCMPVVSGVVGGGVVGGGVVGGGVVGDGVVGGSVVGGGVVGDGVVSEEPLTRLEELRCSVGLHPSSIDRLRLIVGIFVLCAWH
jgi:hypothetical protein